MIVDCETCPVRGVRCDGCMVNELLLLERPSAAGLDLDPGEREAVAVLVDAGLLDAATAATLRARREPWAAYRKVG